MSGHVCKRPTSEDPSECVHCCKCGAYIYTGTFDNTIFPTITLCEKCCFGSEEEPETEDTLNDVLHVLRDCRKLLEGMAIHREMFRPAWEEGLSRCKCDTCRMIDKIEAVEDKINKKGGVNGRNRQKSKVSRMV